MKTPAVTMVAAWISAETGVGPSIASGSQVCRPNCADLPMAPMNSSRQARSRACRQSHAEEHACVVPAMSGARGEDRRRSGSMPNSQKTADDAEHEAEVADAVDDEGLDRRGVGRRACCTRSRSAGRTPGPRPSQPKNSCRKLLAVTSISMEKVKSDEIAKKRGIAGVVGHVAEGVDVHHRRHEGHHDHHHRRQRVDPERPVDLEACRRRSRCRAGPSNAAVPTPTSTNSTIQDSAADDQQRGAGDDLRAAGRRSRRPNRPATTAPSSGSRTTSDGRSAWSAASALHQR